MQTTTTRNQRHCSPSCGLGAWLLHEERALLRCVGLRIVAVHATSDDTTTASVYTEVSARQDLCFTVGKENSAEGGWHCGAAGMHPALPLEGPAAVRGPGLSRTEENQHECSCTGEGHMAGLPWPVPGP